MDERTGDLHPLAHALRIRSDGAVGGIGEVDRGDRAGSGGLGVREPLQPGGHLDEPAPVRKSWTASRSGTSPM